MRNAAVADPARAETPDADINAVYERYRQNPSPRRLEAVTEAGRPLVCYYANMYGGGCGFEDLCQTGLVGLLKAAENYRPQKETAFLTWASWCIISEIRHYVRKERAYYRPRRVEELQRQVDEALLDAVKKGESPPDETELAARVGLTGGVREIMKAGLTSLSELDTDRIASQAAQSFQLPLEDSIALGQALEKLGELEKKVVYLLFYRGYSQQKAAQSLGVNQRKVSRVKISALGQLRKTLGGSFELTDNSHSFKRIK